MFLTCKIRILQCAFAIVLSLFLAKVSVAQVGAETEHWANVDSVLAGWDL